MVYSTENFYKTFESVRKLVPYKIRIISVNDEEVLVRSSLKDLDETAAFVEAYETVTHSHFEVVPSKIHFCRRKWICNHTVVSGTNEKCPASINIFIKKMNKQNTLKDAFLRRNPPHPAVIKIISNHNHPLMVPLSPFKLLRVNDGVKECFYEYFKRGYYGARAKSLHEQYLRKSNFYAFEDDSMNPSLPAIFTLYNNWLKMNGSMQVDGVSSGSLQAPNIQKAGTNEIPQFSFQNLEAFINMEDTLSRLKTEPEDDYTPAENIVSEAIEDIKPVLNIKQEIIDADENDGLPVISSYGSLVTTPPPALPSQPIVAAKAEPVMPRSKQIIATKSKTKTAETTIQNVAAVVKVIQPSSSRVVVYDKSSNTYKVVNCLAVNGDTYSPSHCKSYLTSSLPSRISLQKP